MKRPLPDGAGEIYDLRIRKKIVPNEIVFVSLVGDMLQSNWIVCVNSNQRPEFYDWTWVRNLQICLVYDSTIHKDIVKDYAETIARCKPNGGYMSNNNFSGFLYLWNIEKKAGAHLSYTPEIIGDIDLGITTIEAECHYRRLWSSEVQYLEGV